MTTIRQFWTWQDPVVCDALELGRRHHAQWSRIPQGCEVAYHAMARQMSPAGRTDKQHPPVWIWCDEPDAETIADRAFHVVREGEAERGLVVLTIEVPESLVLFSSYAGWCERLADPTSRRTWDPAPELGPTDLQGCLPYLEPAWVTDARPLPADVVLMAIDETAHAS